MSLINMIKDRARLRQEVIRVQLLESTDRKILTALDEESLLPFLVLVQKRAWPGNC
jgi:hypothetical protein